MVNSACSFGYKIGNGIGSALLGLILEMGGYVGEAAVQSASALTSIKAMGMEAYKAYIEENYKKKIREIQKYFPVVCGEWCLFNSLACSCDTKGGQSVLNGVDGSQEEL